MTQTNIPEQQYRVLILVIIMFAIGALVRWLFP